MGTKEIRQAEALMSYLFCVHTFCVLKKFGHEIPTGSISHIAKQ